MQNKLRKPAKETRPGLQKGAARRKRLPAKYANPLSEVDIGRMIQGPREQLVGLCRELISKKKITTRTEFGRFAPKELKEHLRKNPDLWEEMGIPHYHQEVRRNGGSAWRAHCESTLGQKPAEHSPAPRKSAPLKKPAAARGSTARSPNEKNTPHTPSAFTPKSPSSPGNRPKAESGQKPAPRQPTAPAIFREWAQADAEGKRTIKKALFKAAVSGPVSSVCAMLEHGAPVGLKDEFGRPFFMFVAERGRISLLKELVKYMRNVDRRDSKGENMLMACAECGHLKCMRVLLKLKGKNKPALNARNKENRTAIMLAAWEGHLEAVKELHKAGANPRLRDKYRKNAKDYAELEGHRDVAEYLHRAK
ncbi:hypothetical protein GF412_05120 [Candidatus Micrarchaeota archaeon]|nr:hypothetical protein [Candidatus Micrarchaeota archaeon]MBD3418335.1 hypothetical protein [Candidatus Micrarchaeota archaeon]